MSAIEPAKKEMPSGEHGAGSDAGSAEPDAKRTTEDLLHGLQAKIRQILESELDRPVISESPHQQTGGGYQTVRMGDEVRAGFRMSRPNLLRGIDLKGLAVCDLGANLGEISRDLRRAGAARVDAYEYDPYFTQLARYITAYNGISHINHFQADVAEQGFLRRRYDLCVGLSAYSFMGRNINYICRRISDQVLIETHEVRDHTWHRKYVEPITRHFPHWCCFAHVAHGAAADKRRLWLMFSKNPLAPFYARRAAEVLPHGEGVIDVDLPRSTLHFDRATEHILEQADEPLSEESIRRHSEKLADYERQFDAGEEVHISMSGEAYWLALLCGIAQFEADDGLNDDNVYLQWFTRGVAAGQIDPAFKPLLERRKELHRRLSFRLRSLRQALRQRDVSHFPDIPIAYNATPFHPALGRLIATRLVRADSDEQLSVPNLDGQHRLFVAKLLGIDRFPMMTIWDPRWLMKIGTDRRVTNYEKRMYQYVAGAEVDDPVVGPTG